MGIANRRGWSGAATAAETHAAVSVTAESRIEGADMIEAVGLTKRYGTTVAVNNLSFSVAGGKVTGFLGPNGAGKSTTMRMILGLDNPTSGKVTIGGKLYRDLKDPLRTV